MKKNHDSLIEIIASKWMRNNQIPDKIPAPISQSYPACLGYFTKKRRKQVKQLSNVLNDSFTLGVGVCVIFTKELEGFKYLSFYIILYAVSKGDLRRYSKCYCSVSVTKTFTLKVLQTIYR
jgi:hypothetical protein